MSKIKRFDAVVALKYCGIIVDLSQTTKEKIAYHKGKEYFRLNGTDAAQAYPESEMR